MLEHPSGDGDVRVGDVGKRLIADFARDAFDAGDRFLTPRGQDDRPGPFFPFTICASTRLVVESVALSVLVVSLSAGITTGMESSTSGGMTGINKESNPVSGGTRTS